MNSSPQFTLNVVEIGEDFEERGFSTLFKLDLANNLEPREVRNSLLS